MTMAEALMAIEAIVRDTSTRPTRRLDRILKVILQVEK